MVFRKKIKLFFLVVLIAASSAHARGKNGIALVYDGPGVCEDGCLGAAVAVATEAGLTVKIVKSDALNDQSTDAEVLALYEGARVWVQPGGIGNYALEQMNERLSTSIKKFVEQGGGYVGFCAGAFMATEWIARFGGAGLGIFPGNSYVYPANPERGLTFSLQTVKWNGKERKIYFEGGPYFIFDEDAVDKASGKKKVEVIARYENEAVAAARTVFGKGRVFITGLHPEAPLDWTKEDDIVDPDGSDQDLAIAMVKWAAKMKGAK